MKIRVALPAVATAFLLIGPVTAHAQAAAGRDASACLAQLRTDAPANGVSVADFDRYTQGVQLLESTISAARSQPEHRDTWWAYLAKAVDQERVDDGKAVLTDIRPKLDVIGERFQVDPEILVAIFGIETNYGRQLGKTPVLDAWVTRACTESNRLWKANVYASVRLLRDGLVQRDEFVGSWSGAFGMTQFIPTSFYELATDGDGDGKPDLYHSLPDALASTANHLRKRGAQWTHGLPPVVEVRLPAGIAKGLPDSPDAEILRNEDRRTFGQWIDAGVRAADGGPLSVGAGSARAYLFAPTGSKGPVFLATSNFDAILHYNRSHRYALSVALLVNRLAGGTDLATPWPTDDPGLSRAEIRELQTLLLARGHDLGTADGIPGAKTRDAIRAEQRRLNLREDGIAGMKALEALRAQ
ncbi:lytic murein transglycosylase [Verticiella alkaliphila]|uniref:lytic murein transglycosylase n=1 Tax=Verticiella alkaliphila TaxID=2779529 RepID=UPI0035303C59